MITLKKLQILAILRDGQSYGTEIADKSANRFPGSKLYIYNIYSTLAAMLRDGLVEKGRIVQVSGKAGRARQYYMISPKGIELADGLIKGFNG